MANVKGQVHRPFRVGLSDAGVMDGASNSAKVARALVSSHSRVSARSWVEYVYWCNAVSLACLFLFVVAFKNHLHVHLISHVLLRGPWLFSNYKRQWGDLLREAQQTNAVTRLQVYGQPQWPISQLSITSLWFNSWFSWWFSGMVLWHWPSWVGLNGYPFSFLWIVRWMESAWFLTSSLWSWGWNPES